MCFFPVTELESFDTSSISKFLLHAVPVLLTLHIRTKNLSASFFSYCIMMKARALTTERIALKNSSNFEIQYTAFLSDSSPQPIKQLFEVIVGSGMTVAEVRRCVQQELKDQCDLQVP